MPFSKKKCTKCDSEFNDQTKDQRYTKCRTCRNTRTCRDCGCEFYNETGEGFCDSCMPARREAVARYLDPKPRGHGTSRTQEQQEATYETKYGTGHG